MLDSIYYLYLSHSQLFEILNIYALYLLANSAIYLSASNIENSTSILLYIFFESNRNCIKVKATKGEGTTKGGELNFFKFSEYIILLQNFCIAFILSFRLLNWVPSFKGIVRPSKTKTIFPKFSIDKNKCNCYKFNFNNDNNNNNYNNNNNNKNNIIIINNNTLKLLKFIFNLYYLILI